MSGWEKNRKQTCPPGALFGGPLLKLECPADTDSPSRRTLVFVARGQYDRRLPVGANGMEKGPAWHASTAADGYCSTTSLATDS